MDSSCYWCSNCRQCVAPVEATTGAMTCARCGTPVEHFTDDTVDDFLAQHKVTQEWAQRVLPARWAQGDCRLLKSNSARVLIDGGVTTWSSYIGFVHLPEGWYAFFSGLRNDQARPFDQVPAAGPFLTAALATAAIGDWLDARGDALLVPAGTDKPWARVGLAEILSIIGEDTYAEACRLCRESAPQILDVGTSDMYYEIDIPMEISELVWDSNASQVEKLQFLFEQYHVMPSASLLFSPLLDYEGCTAETRAMFWNQVRALLSQPDPVWAVPLMFALWSHFFEDSRREEEAWQALVTPDAPPALIDRVLYVSGPVPFAWKQALYERLLADPRRHPAIFRSLLASQFETYGQIDPAAARAILRRLDLSSDTPHLADLETALNPP